MPSEQYTNKLNGNLLQPNERVTFVHISSSWNSTMYSVIVFSRPEAHIWIFVKQRQMMKRKMLRTLPINKMMATVHQGGILLISHLLRAKCKLNTDCHSGEMLAQIGLQFKSKPLTLWLFCSQ
jgi:hypothetical protein